MNKPTDPNLKSCPHCRAELAVFFGDFAECVECGAKVRMATGEIVAFADPTEGER